MPIRILALLGAAALIGGWIWNAFADAWVDRGCSRGQSFALVLMYGTPDPLEGCVAGPDGPEYTDVYVG
ncbi:hypothetical protein ACFQLX_16575 [Streptomyces polyrhachis]|uniref:Secreted protein n=1 Tax=Streptomyces polyrhachis TaxID=1282885 RepID=A0ABW2GJW7_9ACTN